MKEKESPYASTLSLMMMMTIMSWSVERPYVLSVDVLS